MDVSLSRQTLRHDTSNFCPTSVESVLRHDTHPDTFTCGSFYHIVSDSGYRASKGRMIHGRWAGNYSEGSDGGLTQLISRHFSRGTESAYFATWWRWGTDGWEVQREQEMWFRRRQIQQSLASGQGQCRGANSMHAFLLRAFHVQCNLPPSSLPYHQQVATVRTPYIRLKSPGSNDWVRNNRW